MVKYTKQFIDGEWVDSESADTIDVINPATEEVFQTVAAGNKADVDKAVAAAKKHIYPLEILMSKKELLF